MACHGDGAVNNGLGRRSLHQWEGRLLYMAGYPAQPDFRAPEGWRLSAGGVMIPLPPVGAALDAVIDEVIETLSDEQRAEPRFFADDYDTWNAFFRRRYERELTGPHPRRRARAHRAWQLPHPGDAAFPVTSTWELVDATGDGILLVRVGIDVEDDGQEGAGVDTADQRVQQRRPHNPRGGARLVITGCK
jgi:hypothetical protein